MRIDDFFKLHIQSINGKMKLTNANMNQIREQNRYNITNDKNINEDHSQRIQIISNKNDQLFDIPVTTSDITFGCTSLNDDLNTESEADFIKINHDLNNLDVVLNNNKQLSKTTDLEKLIEKPQQPISIVKPDLHNSVTEK